MKRLVVLGDSHVAALSQGFDQLGAAERSAFPGEVVFLKLFDGPDNIVPFFRAADDRIEFTSPRVTDELAAGIGQGALKASDTDTVFAFSLGLMTTLLVRMPDWKYGAPVGAWGYTEKKHRLRQLVSPGVVKAIVLDHHKYALGLAAAARDLGLRSLIVSAPPLRQDERAIERGRDPRVLAEVDRIARATMLDAFAGLGTPVVLPPPEASQEGAALLRPEFHRIAPRDTHHANADYGALMIRRVLRQAAETFG